MERDLIETRGFQPTPLTDADDPPRFGQLLELIKDALTETLRLKFKFPSLTPERLAEAPSARKYAFGYAPGTDPYETAQQLAQEFPDFFSKLPQVTVNVQSANTSRLSIGRPILETVWPAPVLETSAGPWAFTDPTPQVTTAIVVTAVVGGVYTLTVSGGASVYTAIAGDTTTDIVRGLRLGLAAFGDAGVNVEYERDTLVLTGRSGEPFTVALDAPAASTILTTTPGGGDLTASYIDLRVETAVGGVAGDPVVAVYRVAIDPVADPTAVDADELAQCVTQSCAGAVRAVPATNLAGAAVLLVNPNVRAVEVLSTSTTAAAVALGLARAGTGAITDSVAGVGPVYTVTLAGAAFTAADVNDYLTLDGARHLVTNFVSASVVEVTETDGLAPPAVGPLSGVPWFLGLRGDRLESTPVRRFAYGPSIAQMSIDIWAESSTERTELADAVAAWIAFFAEDQHFLFGDRATQLDPIGAASIPESWTADLDGEVQRGTEGNFQFGDDAKQQVYTGTVAFPLRAYMYINRLATVPDGPDAGQPWTPVLTEVRAIPT